MIQVIHGKVPSKVKKILDDSEFGHEEWVRIPFIPRIYLMSKTGRIIRFCKYEGKNLKPHFRELSTREKRVRIGEKRIGIKELYFQLFGISHHDNVDDYRWLDIRGFEGLYQISEKGEVRSYPKTIHRSNGAQMFIHNRIIKTFIINSGYKTVKLHKNKKVYSRLIHRLVAEHFITNENNYTFVNHKDEDKTNNCVDNLEWCTMKYNNNYGTCQQRRIKTRRKNKGGRY